MNEKPDYIIKFANEFRKAREEKGLNKKELEALSGVKQQTITKIERGNLSFSVSTVLKVLCSLDKTLAIVEI